MLHLIELCVCVCVYIYIERERERVQQVGIRTSELLVEDMCFT